MSYIGEKKDMKEEKAKKENNFNIPITVGLVGHVPIQHVKELKDAVETIPEFDLVFFKTSNGRLWIKEGDQDE